jgi:hypothetical protein
MRWGRVTPEARAMVAEWLKLEFIEAFFTLLAEEHIGDNRRLEFWARYVNAIEDIHFALGTDARENRSPDFQALRKKMAGLVVPLQDNVRTNNAFIMRMGSLVIVEFSGYSNACYAYDANKALPFRFDIPVVLPKNMRNSLKHSNHALWLAHQGGVRGFDTWEERFEAELAQGYGIKPKGAKVQPMVMMQPIQTPHPSQAAALTSPPPSHPGTTRPRPSPTAERSRFTEPDPTSDIASWTRTNYSRKALSEFAERFGLQIEDLTPPPRGGNLWVRTGDSHIGINEVLLKWGFRFKNASKGWWRSGK